ncbi:recombinase family protein [Mesorhizobium sp. L103C105A0]|uniref:recombinase family protein n=1 Tax=Mesorhizobium sp. L103C105A0 TaxID=1287074 RepID=UPI0003D032A8|nr:recombinase family protein [Mesorhizobium sp. L103C105A0]ESZ78290.1 resolvase [Mesorhizobium sp. L103C105A0]
MKRVALYLRVSTKEQTTENQRIELERVATARGWQMTAIYEDEGISGAKGRDRRPGYDRLLKDAVRAKFEVIMAWDVSRLGRSLAGLVTALDELHAQGIDLYLHQQAIDTTTPSGKAMFQMTGVFAEFERSMIRERVKAGLVRAKSQGITLGRPRIPADRVSINEDRKSGLTVRQIAAKHRISVGTAHHLLRQTP